MVSTQSVQEANDSNCCYFDSPVGWGIWSTHRDHGLGSSCILYPRHTFYQHMSQVTRLFGTQLALLSPHLIQHIYVLDIRVVHANSPFCSPHHEDEPRQDVSHELSPQLDVVRHLVSFRQPHSKHVGLGLDRFSHLIHFFRYLGSVSRRTLLLFLRWVDGFAQQRWWAVPSSCTLQDPNRRWCIGSFPWITIPFDALIDVGCFAAGGGGASIDAQKHGRVT